MWIERSGASFEFLDGLLKTFPDARFVHIHRDGPEAALSMREHAHFRQIVSYHYDPPSTDEIRRTALHLDPPESDPFRKRVDGPQDIRRYADYWTYSVVRGYSVMPQIDSSHLLDLRFEDLLANPRGVLNQLAQFFDLPQDEHWIERAITHISNEIPKRAATLQENEQQALKAGCYYGQLLLRRETDPSPVIEANRIAREVFDSQS